MKGLSHTHTCIHSPPNSLPFRNHLLWTKDDTGCRIQGEAGELATRHRKTKGLKMGDREAGSLGSRGSSRGCSIALARVWCPSKKSLPLVVASSLTFPTTHLLSQHFILIRLWLLLSACFFNWSRVDSQYFVSSGEHRSDSVIHNLCIYLYSLKIFSLQIIIRYYYSLWYTWSPCFF